MSLLLAPLHWLPAEDVVILHSYSRNLAHTGAITFYAGGPHAEGATDFGWMLLLAAGMRLGFAPAWMTAVLNVGSLTAIAWLLCTLAGVTRKLVTALALCGVASLLPQALAALSGFAVLPFAALLLGLVLTCLGRRAVASAWLALGLCLLRPDGVLFAVPLLVWLATHAGAHQRRRIISAALAYFVLPGLLYFVWRWHYFGSLMPLPFLVKASTPRWLGLLVPRSVGDSLKYLVPLAAVLVTQGRLQSAQRSLLVCLVAIPTLFYWAMRLDQNVGDRFFFYLPLGTAVLIAVRWPDLLQQRRHAVLFTGAVSYLVLLLGPFLREVRTFRDFQFRDTEAIARGLQQLPRGSLLTTEAGFLPFGSQWVAYDAWGLNTASFAHRLIQPADVQRLTPDLVVVHAVQPSSCTPVPAVQLQATRTWNGMIENVLLGVADTGSYSTWRLSYGSDFRRKRHHWAYGQGDVECFFVKRQSPQYGGIAALLEQHHAMEESP